MKNKDTIYRQAAIDALRMDISIIPYAKAREYVRATIEEIYNRLEELPSIQSERKRGRFVGTEFDRFADGDPVFYEWQCSECGCVFEDEEPTYNFCPNCGAKMERCEQE